MLLTPGITFIVKTAIPGVLLPPALVHAALILAARYWAIFTPTRFLLACIYVLWLPTNLIVTNCVSRLRNARASRRLGARVAPTLEGVLPGNIDLLYRGISANKDEYLGEPWLHAMKVYGTTFTINVLNLERFCTINPRNIQKVLVTDFECYRKSRFISEIVEPMLGTGVFNSDGELWQFHRKMIRPFLSKERVTDLQLYERKTTIALQKMQERLDCGFAIDFQDLVSRFTFDSAAEFLLGASVHSLDSPLPLPYNSQVIQDAIADTASTRVSRAFATAQVMLLNRVERLGLWPLAEIFEDKIKKPMAEIRDFMDPIVRHAIKKREQGASKDDQTLLGHMLDVTDDMKMIVDETLNLMLAGRDTTASLLTFVIYCLATHPTVWSRLRDEIISTVGSTRSPSYDDLRSMRYLRAVLNETLRLFPPVPFNVRETINETTWVDDEGQKLYVPPNSGVTLSILHLHRFEAYWGPDAHIFDPDRWHDERVRRYTSNPFIFVPFNAGPRICVGQQFVYNEASFFLVRLLQHFERVELAPHCQPPKTRPPASWANAATAPLLGMRRPLERCFPRAHLTLYVDGGLWILAKQAEDV